MVSAAWEFVKQKLDPHPAHGFSPTNASDRDTPAMHITRDVTITRGTGDEFEIEVIESRRFVLRINPMYTRLAADLHRSSASVNTDEKKHIQQYRGRAKLFIANIKRRQTMFMITTCIVERERAHLEDPFAATAEPGRHRRRARHSREYRQPSLSQQVRVVTQWRGDPVLALFSPSLSIRVIMKEAIAKEGKPLTDHDIQALLKARGIHIARRTVSKYRVQLDIPSSALR